MMLDADCPASGCKPGVWSTAVLRASDRLLSTTTRHDAEAEAEAYGIVPVGAVVDDLATFALELSEPFEVGASELEKARTDLLDAHPDYRHVRDVLAHAVDFQAGVGDRQHPGVWRRDRRTPQLAPMDVWVSGVGADTQIGMHGTDAQRGMVGVHGLGRR